MGIGPSLDTWGNHGRFTYAGSVEKGTRIVVGRESSFTIGSETYQDLLAHFRGRRARIGNSRRPPNGSLGSWLRRKVGGEIVAAYVGPILTREGHAERVGDEIVFTE